MGNKLSKQQIAAYRDRLAASDSEYEMVPVPTRDLRALIAELEAAERQSHGRYVRIAELESKLVNAAHCITGLERHVKDIEATLIAATDEVADLAKERDEARGKLATPVRLPNGIAQKIKVPGYYEAINEMMDCVRSAGFSIKVDE